MRILQKMLKDLGWPIDQMSFKEIAQELYRRWFKAPPEVVDEKSAISAASAAGIVVAMAGEGNISALCWDDETPALKKVDIPLEEMGVFLRGEPKEKHAGKERRSASRAAGREIVLWSDSEKGDGSGFLVDYSPSGIAFIAESDRSPRVGTRLSTSIQDRTRGQVDLGWATVVRCEVLTPELTLTCLRLDLQQLILKN